jgi:hypothetical protein
LTRLARPAAGRLNVKIVAVTIAMSSFSMESVIEGCGLWVRSSSSKNDPVTLRISKPTKVLLADRIYTSLLESINLVTIGCLEWGKRCYITRLELVGGMRRETT